MHMSRPYLIFGLSKYQKDPLANGEGLQLSGLICNVILTNIFGLLYIMYVICCANYNSILLYCNYLLGTSGRLALDKLVML